MHLPYHHFESTVTPTPTIANMLGGGGGGGGAREREREREREKRKEKRKKDVGESFKAQCALRDHVLIFKVKIFDEKCRKCNGGV